VPPSG